MVRPANRALSLDLDALRSKARAPTTARLVAHGFSRHYAQALAEQVCGVAERSAADFRLELDGLPSATARLLAIRLMLEKVVTMMDGELAPPPPADPH